MLLPEQKKRRCWCSSCRCRRNSLEELHLKPYSACVEFILPPLYPFHHLKPEVFVLLGFRKCLAYFVRQPQRNFFLWNFIYCLRSVEFVEFELDFVLHELSQQQNVSFLFLFWNIWLTVAPLSKSLAYYIIIIFSPSRLYFSSPSSFLQKAWIFAKNSMC